VSEAQETKSAFDIDGVAVIPSHTVAAQTDVDVVVHNLQNSTNYRLNDVGMRIWELLESGQSIRSIGDTLIAEYRLPDDVSADAVRNDVLAVITELHRYGLIQAPIAPSPAS
jgi:hypothetical protein